MEFNKEKLDEITRFAGLFFTPKQVAIICEIPIKEMNAIMQIESSEVYLAYWKGYYTAEVEFREEIKKSSNFGSSPAQTLWSKILEQHKMDMIE